MKKLRLIRTNALLQVAARYYPNLDKPALKREIQEVNNLYRQNQRFAHKLHDVMKKAGVPKAGTSDYDYGEYLY